MCLECGCSKVEAVMIDGKEMPAGLHRPEAAVPSHHHADSSRKISLERDILHKNNHIAHHNRQLLLAKRVVCANFISAPGSGKTALLERLIADHGAGLRISVIEGDQQTDNDARRIRNAGAMAVQINTGSACHLDAEMIHQALDRIDLDETRLLVIENVGNMVCPTAYDLGETFKVAVISCPEGDDKPEKYPDLLLASDVLLINKTDLIPYLNFDLEKCTGLAKKINPNLKIFPVSAQTGEGLDTFYGWMIREFSLE